MVNRPGWSRALFKKPVMFFNMHTVQRFSRAGPRGRGRERATLEVHPLSWLLSNNRLEEVCSTLTKGTFSSRLLLSNQDKGCTPTVAHSLPLPLGPALLNLSCVSGTHVHGTNGLTRPPKHGTSRVKCLVQGYKGKNPRIHSCKESPTQVCENPRTFS